MTQIKNSGVGFTTYGLRRAVVATGAFSIVGFAALTSIVDWGKSWPLV